MTSEMTQKILELGNNLSNQWDFHALLEQILSDAMLLTNCHIGILYLKEEEFLHYKSLCVSSMKTYWEEDIDLPLIPVEGRHVCSAAIIENRTIYVEDVNSCGEYECFGILRYKELAKQQKLSMLVVPMRGRNKEIVGTLQLIHIAREENAAVVLDYDCVNMVDFFATQAAIAIQNIHYVEESRGLFHSFVQVVSSAIDERTPYNAAHTRKMVDYAECFIDYINSENEKKVGCQRITTECREELLMSIWLHDIGKLVMPLKIMNKAAKLLPEDWANIQQRFQLMRLQSKIDYLEGRKSKLERQAEESEINEAERFIMEVDQSGCFPEDKLGLIGDIAKKSYSDINGMKQPWLTKKEVKRLLIRQGTLSEEERKIMEGHVVLTQKLLSKIEFSKNYEHVLEWASKHHEFLNGTGYPNQLSGEQIPYEVRIITILDIFDALTADDRPYKEGMSVERALSILQNMAAEEGKLDVELTNQFIASKCWKICIKNDD